MSFILLAPVSLFIEGVKFTPAYLQSAVSFLYLTKNDFPPQTHVVKTSWPSDIYLLFVSGVER